jgi:hypothetical protein
LQRWPAIVLAAPDGAAVSNTKPEFTGNFKPSPAPAIFQAARTYPMGNGAYSKRCVPEPGYLYPFYIYLLC